MLSPHIIQSNLIVVWPPNSLVICPAVYGTALIHFDSFLMPAEQQRHHHGLHKQLVRDCCGRSVSQYQFVYAEKHITIIISTYGMPVGKHSLHVAIKYRHTNMCVCVCYHFSCRFASAQFRPALDADNQVSDVRVSQSGGITTYSFTLPCMSSDSQDIPLNGSHYLLFATGRLFDGNLAYHGGLSRAVTSNKVPINCGTYCP